MFKKTRKRIHNIITYLKASFELAVATVEKLTDAIDTNTASNRILTQEQRELRAKLDVLVENTHFLVRARKNELSRQGHQVV